MIFAPNLKKISTLRISYRKSFLGSKNLALQFLNFLGSVAPVSHRLVSYKKKVYLNSWNKTIKVSSAKFSTHEVSQQYNKNPKKELFILSFLFWMCLFSDASDVFFTVLQTRIHLSFQ